MFVIRPLARAALLAPIDLTAGERRFILWGGLKGAVPILLASFALLGDVDNAERIYLIVFVVVAISVTLHAATIPSAAQRLGVPMELASCHTAEVGGYAIEGHVPAADIRRLLAERPAGARGPWAAGSGAGPRRRRHQGACARVGRSGRRRVRCGRRPRRVGRSRPGWGRPADTVIFGISE